MNYCSLKDAWGDTNYISNQYKEYDKPTKVIEKETFVNTENTQINCNDIIDHIRKCKKCYKKLKYMMKSKLLIKFETLVEDNKDMIVIILIGISIVLFFNLINNITK